MIRRLSMLAALALTACNATPASIGITGPGAPPPPPPAIDDSTILNPGIPDPGNGYGPGVGTHPSAGQFYNYN